MYLLTNSRVCVVGKEHSYSKYTLKVLMIAKIKVN